MAYTYTWLCIMFSYSSMTSYFKAGHGFIITYSAICLYRHPLGRNFYVDIRKCRNIDITQK